jgi:hypothetical protein
MIWLLVLGQITAFPQLGPFMLNARVQVQADKGRWHYTVCNDEKGFLVGLFQIEQIDVRKGPGQAACGLGRLHVTGRQHGRVCG